MTLILRLAVASTCILASSPNGNQLIAAEIDNAVADVYQPLIYQSPGGGSLPYRLLEPKSVEPGEKYPLVLVLHGAGERGDDNKIQLVHVAGEFARDDRRDDYPAFVLFPQCPAGKRWVESDWGLNTGRGEFANEPSEPMRLVLELVDALAQDRAVDTGRMYVTGLSMGGMGTWFAAQAKPKRFAAMLEICGGGDPQWADRYNGIPIWIFHGQADTAVPIAQPRNGRSIGQCRSPAGTSLRRISWCWTQQLDANVSAR